MIRVLIVASYAATRAGLHALLQDAENLAIVDEAESPRAAEQLLPLARPDVLLLDLGAEDSAQLLELAAQQEIGVVWLGDESSQLQSLAQTFSGYGLLRKDASGAEIAAAVRAVAAGLIVFDSAFAPSFAPTSRTSNELSNENSGENLTPRELEVLQLMASGLPNKIIAARLGISRHTAKFHVASILAKLGAASRTEAVTRGVRRGDVIL